MPKIKKNKKNDNKKKLDKIRLDKKQKKRDLTPLTK